MLEMDNLWNTTFDDYEEGVDEGTSSLVVITMTLEMHLWVINNYNFLHLTRKRHQ